MSDLSLEDQNFADEGTQLIGEGGGFIANIILQVRPPQGNEVSHHDRPSKGLVAIQGIGNASGGGSVGVWGLGGDEELGVGGHTSVGVRGTGFKRGEGVNGISSDGIGVLGQSETAGGVRGVQGLAAGAAIIAQFQQPAGVEGYSKDNGGVHGVSEGHDGAGVVGQNIRKDHDRNRAVGVLGVCESQSGAGVFGNNAFGNGVEGFGSVGVFGLGNVGGVFSVRGRADLRPGDAPPGRAGVFVSDTAAQVRLLPHPHNAGNIPAQETTINAVPILILKVQEELPANGQPGDFLCTMMLVESRPPSERATLWFCEQGGVDKNHPAKWRQVLLGPAVSGQG